LQKNSLGGDATDDLLWTKLWHSEHSVIKFSSQSDPPWLLYSV